MAIMKSFQKTMIAAGLMLMAASQQVHADVVVIVSAQSTAPPLSPERIARIFEGKSTDMTPVDLARPSDARREFYTKFVGVDDALVRGEWSKLVFTGKRSAPREFTSSADLVKAVAADPNIIGYVDRSFVNMTVKILYTVK
jgi:ABC-type phosphate transport system substrate-binding protein